MTSRPDVFGNQAAPPAPTLECDAPDEGVLVVPAALIAAFPEVEAPSGVCSGSDCPPSSLARYRVARVVRPDLDLELRAENAVVFGLAHRSSTR